MCHKLNSICLLWRSNAKNDSITEVDYDDLEVNVLKTLTHGSEIQILMGREVLVFISIY